MTELILAFGVLTAAGGCFFVWTHAIEPNWFYLRKKRVQVGKTLKEPLTILHLSDLHFTGPRFFLSRFFDRLSAIDLDFVFITGDLIDGNRGIKACVENLRKLKPKKGTFAVLGNHDYRSYPLKDQLFRLFTLENYGRDRPEVEELKAALREIGVILLANENRKIALAGEKDAILIGIDDPVTGRANLNQAFRGIEDGAFRMALIHSPAPFPSLGKRGVDVAFAGHTHGGQIRLPGVGPLPIAYRLEPIIDSTDQYGFVGLISRGLGASPVMRPRFLCRPEALLVRIEGANAS
jgi:hypothetical protein